MIHKKGGRIRTYGRPAPDLLGWVAGLAPLVASVPEIDALRYPARFYGRSATPGCRRRPWGDLVVPTGWRRWGIPDEGTLGEPPTPTIVHVRSILDLTNCPSYLLYVLDSLSLSQ
ncbi:unnamed protein product [Dovyalis caffra]|uniref:Uncharacterized protein n=1 Tax=Dovyalis caffra TaxID=77055 RepID=A0AAV1QSA0_9ROSI|nr:unnamed protein product [Dovyalis caffra]